MEPKEGEAEGADGYRKGDRVPAVRLKEFNFFDGMYIVSMKSELMGTEMVTWDTVAAGQMLTGRTDGVVTSSKAGPHVSIKINNFLTAILPLEHISDRPVAHVPEKLKAVDKEIRVRVFTVNKLTKTLIVTRKKLLLRPHTPIIKSREEVEVGQDAYGVVGKSIEGGMIVRFMNDIAGFLADEQIPEDVSLKPGQTVHVYVGYINLKQKKIGLALTPEGARIVGQKQAADSDDIKQVLADVTADLNTALTEETRSTLAVGQVFTFSLVNKDVDEGILRATANYLVFKTVNRSDNFYVHVPKSHLSDHKQHIDQLFEILTNLSEEQSAKREFRYLLP
jgi:hypothetical protein